MSVCRSVAWNEKVITSAWWVYDHQVSKTAPSGEYLTTGSFMIRGKKNFLPPTPLVMGFGFFFKVHESSIARHLNERSKTNLDQDNPEEEVVENDEELSTNDIQSKEVSNKKEQSSSEKRSQEEKRKELLGSFGFGVDSASIINDLTASQEDVDNLDEKIRKKRVTAKEKRQIKKGTAEEPQQSALPKETKGPKEPKEKEDSQKHLPRGKKGKLKKMKEKYGDQDEEERNLKMEIRGVDD